MPGLLSKPQFQHITVQELHRTFGAEISGVNFQKPISNEVFVEILAAISKVGGQEPLLPPLVSSFWT
jgi:alpha-ketoglutarate-dependent 2,4-dichlorophenoxyacetate dioxygenase